LSDNCIKTHHFSLVYIFRHSDQNDFHVKNISVHDQKKTKKKQMHESVVG